MVRDREEAERQPWGPRVLAPLAFFAAVAVLVLLVNSSLSSETDEPAAPTSPRATTGEQTATVGTTTTRGGGQRRFYRIRGGDTLEAIAARFDTTVDDLLTLNPGIDANALTPGQRVRIR